MFRRGLYLVGARVEKGFVFGWGPCLERVYDDFGSGLCWQEVEVKKIV